MAAIFHDIGYSVNKEDRHEHAEDGAALACENLEGIGYPAEKTAFVCDLIARQRLAE